MFDTNARSGQDVVPIACTESAVLNPSVIRFGRAICGDLRQSERREWWLTNGLGAYAAGTLADTLTRRYHGLLIAPVDPPLGRRLVLTKADATLVGRNGTWPLHSNRWCDGVIEPNGYRDLEMFHLDGTVPVWTYAIAGRYIEKRIWLEQGSNIVHIAFNGDAPHEPRGCPAQAWSVACILESWWRLERARLPFVVVASFASDVQPAIDIPDLEHLIAQKDLLTVPRA